MIKTLSNKFHNKFIYNRRMNQLANHISNLITKYNCKEILDIGSGDGKIDKLISDSTNIPIKGIDVLIRDKTYIPVEKYDGEHIKLSNNSINTTMLIDVLHHTNDPSIIFKEAVRVSNEYIIIKDHIVHGLISYIKLRLMDYVGNKHYSVNLPYNYLNKLNWESMIKESNLKVIYTMTNLNLYTGLFHLLFDSNLHFIVLLKKDVN